MRAALGGPADAPSFCSCPSPSPSFSSPSSLLLLQLLPSSELDSSSSSPSSSAAAGTSPPSSACSEYCSGCSLPPTAAVSSPRKLRRPPRAPLARGGGEASAAGSSTSSPLLPWKFAAMYCASLHVSRIAANTRIACIAATSGSTAVHSSSLNASSAVIAARIVRGEDQPAKYALATAAFAAAERHKSSGVLP